MLTPITLAKIAPGSAILGTSARIRAGLGSLLVVGLMSIAPAIPAVPAYAPLVASNNTFALELYGQFAAANSGNIFFSPYSVSSCLGMVYDGAAGETAQQMAQALSFSTNQADVGSEFAALDAELGSQQGHGGVSLNIANGLWVQQNFPILPGFLDNATGNFGATVDDVDFITQSPQITGQINQWVSSETQGIITNLFAPGSLNPSTVMALVNAIYFKGAWLSGFDSNHTTVQPFYISPTQTVYVPTMSQTVAPVLVYGDSTLQAVALPYTDTNLVMVILLPNDPNGLTQMDSSLTPQEITAVLNGLVPFGGLDVSLPKFSLSMTANLIPPLRNLGMVDAFEPGAADFSGIDGGKDLSIQVVTHKAVVEVDEAGTVAAGATGIGIIATALPAPIFINRPFVFLICDLSSKSILFMGRVVDPTNGGGSVPPPTTGPQPEIQTTDGNFGMQGNQFGFTVAGTNNSVVVEFCTNVTAGAWSQVRTLTLTNGSAYFSEPVNPNTPCRFYRVRSQ